MTIYYPNAILEANSTLKTVRKKYIISKRKKFTVVTEDKHKQNNQQKLLNGAT